MARPKKQTGPLFDPVVLNVFEGTEDDPLFKESLSLQYVQAAADKLPYLMERFGISDPEDYFGLALALAMTHEPGFQLKTRPFTLAHGDYGAVVEAAPSTDGRPKKWSDERLLTLAADVEAKKRNGMMVREALKALARDQKGEWVRPQKHSGTLDQWVENLESRYQDAKKFIKRDELDRSKHQILVQRLMDLSQRPRKKKIKFRKVNLFLGRKFTPS